MTPRLVSALVSAQSVAQTLSCVPQDLTYLEGQKIQLTAQMSTSTSLSQIVFQLSSMNTFSDGTAIRIQGPISGVKSRLKNMPNSNRFDISDSKADKFELYRPESPWPQANFKGHIRIFFDGGYPLESDMICSMDHIWSQY